MAPQDSVGRIPKTAFVTSISTIFALAVTAVIIRLLYRIKCHKRLALDDAVLILGSCTLIAAFTILIVEVIDKMYLTVALESRMPGVLPPGNPPGNMADIMNLAYDFHKWVTITLMLSWTSIMAAKFSFLAFFWKLIDRIPAMKYYWWTVFLVNVGISGYGISVYVIACPYFNDPRSMECNAGAGKQRLVTHSFVQMSLDLLGDFMILIIPVSIVWKIRVRPVQKLALLLSLGLTVFMIVITIIRVSGLISNGRVDTIWEVYWLVLGAEVGILMAAAIAFRSFFVTRSKSKNATPPEANRFFKSISMKKFRKNTFDDLETGNDNHLPKIPRAHMTGIRTFIGKQGNTMTDTQISKGSLESSISKDHDNLPLRSYAADQR